LKNVKRWSTPLLVVVVLGAVTAAAASARVAGQERSAAKLQCRLRRHGFHVRDTAHTVCAKYLLLLGHRLIETLKARFVNAKV